MADATPGHSDADLEDSPSLPTSANVTCRNPKVWVDDTYCHVVMSLREQVSIHKGEGQEVDLWSAFVHSGSD